MSRERTQDSTPDYRPSLGVKRVERYISTGDKVYRSHYSVNWHGSNRCSACHAYGSLRTGRSRPTKVERPERRVVKICCMLVAIPRAHVGGTANNSGGGCDGAARFKRPQFDQLPCVGGREDRLVRARSGALDVM